MRLFFDTSALLAACGSATGASREIFRRAQPNKWLLIVTPYVVGEVLANLPHLPADATVEWAKLSASLTILDDVFTIKQPAVFGPRKDRPILFSALAWSDVLLTLDRTDFGDLMGNPFYGLHVLKPGTFLERQRDAGKLR